MKSKLILFGNVIFIVSKRMGRSSGKNFVLWRCLGLARPFLLYLRIMQNASGYIYLTLLVTWRGRIPNFNIVG